MFVAEKIQSQRENSAQVHKEIKIKKQHPKAASAIEAEFKLDPVISRILAARNFTADQDLKNYLNPTLKDGLQDPKKLKNLFLAAKLIAEVVAQGKKIAICCDFDVDGLSGGAIIYDLFQRNNIKSQVYVPDRFVDGYGLNERIVRDAHISGAGLLLTIDFGTTNSKELTLAKELGLKTVVVDHHHISSELPPADVIVNPHQSGCGFADKTMCAAGLAWYLAIALKTELKLSNFDSREYLDLACLGTICDMVPLLGVNRTIAKRGLDILTSTRRPGLKALKNLMGRHTDISCTDVSFGIGPRINAAGRIVHGEMVIDLLTTTDSDKAERIAKKLHELNAERQQLESDIKENAIAQVLSNGGPGWGIVVGDKDFHTGVIGIVAQRMVEHFYRPAAVVGVDTEGIFKGSVRGIKGFSVVEALTAVSKHLIKCGGHEGAGGFSVEAEKFDDFKSAFIAECKKRLQSINTVPYAEADTEVKLNEVSVEMIDQLENLAPFGMGNPGAQLLIKNLRVADVKQLKNAHLKVLLSDGKKFISGLMWRQTQHPALTVNNHVNIVCRPEVNTFGSNVELQAILQAVESV